MDERPNEGSLLGDIRREVRQAAAFLTILPLSDLAEGRPDFRLAARSFPIVGALVGCAGGLVLLLAVALHLPPLAAALLAVGATIALTGGLHEDGLADTLDGFGGGRAVADRLAIMRDSRIGTFGVLALLASVGLRVFLIVDWLPDSPWRAAFALIAAETAGRAAMVWLWSSLPTARADGLAASLGAPGEEARNAALVLAVLITVIGGSIASGVLAGLVALAAGALATLAVASWARKKIGGQTGDVLGAVEQITTAAILLALAAFG